MRDRHIPLLAGGLAVTWCLAQVLEAGGLAAAVVVGALWATAALSVKRRSTRALQLALASIMLVLGAILVPLFAVAGQGPAGFYLQLALLVLSAPLAPLLYAFTFAAEPEDDSGP